MASEKHINHLMVCAPGCGIASFSDGQWKVVDSSDDSEDLVAKLNDAKAFLKHFDGEAVLMTFGKSGEHIHMRYNVKGHVNSVKHAEKLTEDEKRQFWRQVASFRLHGPARVVTRVVRRRAEQNPFMAGFAMAGALALAAGIGGGAYFARSTNAVISEANAATFTAKTKGNSEFPRIPHPREMFADAPGNRVTIGGDGTLSGRLNKVSDGWGAK